MRASDLPRAETRLIAPRALRAYAEGLGWKQVEGVKHISTKQVIRRINKPGPISFARG